MPNFLKHSVYIPKWPKTDLTIQLSLKASKSAGQILMFSTTTENSWENPGLLFYLLAYLHNVVAEVCEPRWITTVNTRVLGGTVISASSLEECKAACESNASCTGVDWNPTASAGQACWLSGPCSGHRIVGLAPGFTRYGIVRDCDATGL